MFFYFWLILLFPNGCCANGFDVEGNCDGNCCWVGNIFVCCCAGNFDDTPVDVEGIWGVDEKGALPNIELFKFDTDVWWWPRIIRI